MGAWPPGTKTPLNPCSIPSSMAAKRSGEANPCSVAMRSSSAFSRALSAKDRYHSALSDSGSIAGALPSAFANTGVYPASSSRSSGCASSLRKNPVSCCRVLPSARVTVTLSREDRAMSTFLLVMVGCVGGGGYTCVVLVWAGGRWWVVDRWQVAGGRCRCGVTVEGHARGVGSMYFPVEPCCHEFIYPPFPDTMAIRLPDSSVDTMAPLTFFRSPGAESYHVKMSVCQSTVGLQAVCGILFISCGSFTSCSSADIYRSSAIVPLVYYSPRPAHM